MTLTRAEVHGLPKAELHVHLDGSLRPDTMLDLAREAGIAVPADTPGGLADAMLVRHAHSLEEYLRRYDFTLAVMQTPDALERIAYEFVVDAAAEHVRYVEVRFCPALHRAMRVSQAIEAALAGLRRAQDETGTVARVIICGLRTLPPSVSEDLARAAVDYRHDGVVAFDLAGSERGHPAADHARAFEYAAAHGLARTCHAGEGDGPESIRQAVHVCGAQRIGHGTRLLEDPALEAELIERRIPLEVCLTSNLHTRTVGSVAAHPVRRYMDRGGVVTLNTDSRLMDATSLTDELWLAHTELRFTRAEIQRVIINAVEHSFLPTGEREELSRRFQREFADVA
ncbi:MAG TPA: adenosine deaminase [Gemmatimonadales bacterium]